MPLDNENDKKLKSGVPGPVEQAEGALAPVRPGPDGYTTEQLKQAIAKGAPEQAAADGPACTVCNDAGGAFVEKRTKQLDKDEKPLLDELGKPMLDLVESVPCCDARAPESKPHEEWAAARGLEPMWLRAARLGRGWPLGYEVTEKAFDEAVHAAKFGVIR